MAPMLVQPSSSLSSTSSPSIWHTHTVLGLELWKYLVIAFACFITVLLAGVILWMRPFTRKTSRESVQVQDMVSSANSSLTMKKSSPAISQKLRLLSPKTWKSSSSLSPLLSPSPSSSFGCKDALGAFRFHTHPSAVYDPSMSPPGHFPFTRSSFQTNTHSIQGASLFEVSNYSMSHLLQCSPNATSFSYGGLDVPRTRPFLFSRPTLDYFGIPILQSPSEAPDSSGYSLWNNSKLSPVCGSVISMASSVNYASTLTPPPSMNFDGLRSSANRSPMSASIPSPTRCRFQVPSLPSGFASFSATSFEYAQHKPLPPIPDPESPRYHYL